MRYNLKPAHPKSESTNWYQGLILFSEISAKSVVNQAALHEFFSPSRFMSELSLYSVA